MKNLISHVTNGAKPCTTLFLTLDMYRETGGVQQVSRLLSEVLNEISEASASGKSTSTTYSLHDNNQSMIDSNKKPDLNRKGFNGNKFSFLYHSFYKGFTSDVVILNHIHLLPLGILLVMFRPQVKLILLAHGIEIWRKVPFWKKLALIKKIKIWAVSAFTADHILTKIDKRIQVQILNNALPINFVPPVVLNKPLQLLRKHSLTINQPVLLTVCRMTRHEKEKGIDQVIKAIPSVLSTFPTLKYIIIGKPDQEEKHRLMKLIAEHDIVQHVEFTGFIPQEKLVDYYLLADLFIMPSKKEGFGISFIEAAACGLRIIAGNLDGSRDALLNGRLGTLVNPQDTSQICSSIIKILITPWTKLQAAEIQNICLQHFSHETYRERVKKLLSEPNFCLKPL